MRGFIPNEKQPIFGRGLFGVNPKVSPPVGFVVQVADAGTLGTNFPGASGVQARNSWFGTNNGIAGPSFIGSLISGQATFLPGMPFGFGDCDNAVRIPFVGTSFIVYNPGASNQNAFATVTVNGHTYVTATVPYFDNAGGCGPTYWIWEGVPAGLVSGNQYSATFT